MQNEKPDAAQDPAEGSRETIDRELARQSAKTRDEHDMPQSGSGAIKGGEAAKPGQMQGDEDRSAKGP